MMKGMTLDQFFESIYLPQARNRKRSWRHDKRIYRNHLAREFGGQRLEMIRQAGIRRWLADLIRAGYAPASVNRFLALVRSIFTLACSLSYINVNPCVGIENFKIPLQLERYLSRSEGRALLLWVENHTCQQAKAIALLLLTGARKSEILRARWEQVSFEQGTLNLPVSKSGRPRYIPLSQAALELIAGLPRRSDWLFPGRDPAKPLSDIYQFWNRARQELGLRGVRLHDLRHSFASYLVNAGHSLYEVQIVLGHSSPQTTMRYAHLDRGPLIAAAETVSGLLHSEGQSRTYLRN